MSWTACFLTRSRADPPPKYSMIIHSFVPWQMYLKINTWKCSFPYLYMAFLLLLKLSHLKVWAIILCNKGAVTLAQNCNLLLNVFYLILCFLQIYNFNRHHLLCAVVDAFVNLPKGTLSNPLLFGEVLLGVQPGILPTIEQRKQWNTRMDSWFLSIVCELWAKSSCKSWCITLVYWLLSKAVVIWLKPVVA